MDKNYSSLRIRKLLKTFAYHLFVIIFGVVMVYPLLWMIFSSFKPTNTIFSTAGKLIPSEWTWNNYITGWKGFGNISFAKFFRNSFYISITATAGAVLSSALVAYGFARLRFRGRKILFCAMLVTLMLPAQIMMIPQYLWYQRLNWVGTYQPLIIPYFFATQGFFVYLIQNFISGVPRELDEAAKIDGCSYYSIFTRIILPLIVPALITSLIFSFIWRWDDFLSALLYVSRSEMYPVSLALKLFCDPTTSSDYGAMFAMSTLSVIPVMLIFIFMQKYLVEGIATSGLKG